MQSATEGVISNSQAMISSRIRMQIYRNASKCPSTFPFQKDKSCVSTRASLVLCPSFVSRLKKCEQKCFHPRFFSRQIERVSSSESPSDLLFTANRMIDKMTPSELLFTAKNIQGYFPTTSTDSIVFSLSHTYSTIEQNPPFLRNPRFIVLFCCLLDRASLL